MLSFFVSVMMFSGIFPASAAPIGLNRRSVVSISSTTLSSFAPFTQFARAAYCPKSALGNWNCGEACDALPGFQPSLIGGDGNTVQVFFVGYWPTQDTIVVAHEGTDPTQLQSLLTDANVLMSSLDSGLFPGVASNVRVHDGFRDQHALTAHTILAEVNRLRTANNARSVTIVGHSLGGALAELDSLFLTLNLPSDIAVKAVTYGTPRVGNAAFAQLIDSKVPDFQRINNKKDIIPIVPPRAVGFSHPHGEVHILSPGNAVSCPGDDDATDSQCQIKTVSNIFEGNILDHLGPYEGIHIGTIYCV